MVNSDTMPFKVNDYNSFLSSLYERGSPNGDIAMPDTPNATTSLQFHAQGLPIQRLQLQQQQQQQQQQQRLQNNLSDGMPAYLSGAEAQQQNPKIKSEFPIDFDFGLLPAPLKGDNEQLENTEFALESSLPDQNFDLFVPREDHLFFRPQYQDSEQVSQINGGLMQTGVKRNSNPDLRNKLGRNGNSKALQDPGLEFKLPASSRQSSLDNNNSINNNLNMNNIDDIMADNQLDKSISRNSTTSELVRINSNPNAIGNNIPARPRAKSSHNLIEQRYRNKINDRFELLQECVPTLRVVARRLKKDDSADENDEETSTDLEGLEPARKISKGTILTKLVEYIKFLETKNLRLKQQQEELISRARMMGLDIAELDLGAQ